MWYVLLLEGRQRIACTLLSLRQLGHVFRVETIQRAAPRWQTLDDVKQCQLRPQTSRQSRYVRTGVDASIREIYWKNNFLDVHLCSSPVMSIAGPNFLLGSTQRQIQLRVLPTVEQNIKYPRASVTFRFCEHGVPPLTQRS